jgi:hypothetical protein
MKEKHERHECSREPAPECTGATQLTRMVQIDSALIAHGVHNPLWLSALLGDGNLQVRYRIYNVLPGYCQAQNVRCAVVRQRQGQPKAWRIRQRTSPR